MENGRLTHRQDDWFDRTVNKSLRLACDTLLP